MNITTRITATSTLGLALLLGACSGGGDTEPQATPAATTAPQETTAAPEPEPPTATTTTEPATSPTDPHEAYPGRFAPQVNARMDEDGVFQAEVGDVFALPDANDFFASAAVSLDAVEYFPDYIDGKTLVLLAFTVDNTEGSAPVGLLAPIDGRGGWTYVTADGVAETFYNINGAYSDTFYGRDVTPMHSGPFTPGTKETELVDYIVVEDTDGSIAYTIDGLPVAEIDLPDESVNTDNNGLVRAKEIADELGMPLVEHF